MYGQKTSATLVSTGISAASWWMMGVTITLAIVAAILLGRVYVTMRAGNSHKRP